MGLWLWDLGTVHIGGYAIFTVLAPGGKQSLLCYIIHCIALAPNLGGQDVI